MAEPSLALLQKLLEQMLEEQRQIASEMGRIEAVVERLLRALEGR